MAHRLANDKSATSDVLALSGVALHSAHAVSQSKVEQAHRSPRNRARRCLACWRSIRTASSSNPTRAPRVDLCSGRTARRNSNTQPSEIFASHLTLAISPFVEIEQEVRVILLDDEPLVVYRKERVSDWRHNLDFGARPILLERGRSTRRLRRDRDQGRARRSASASRRSTWSASRERGKVLEINSGVMMEALGRLHPELVYAAYDAALDKDFRLSFR